MPNPELEIRKRDIVPNFQELLMKFTSTLLFLIGDNGYEFLEETMKVILSSFHIEYFQVNENATNIYYKLILSSS